MIHLFFKTAPLFMATIIGLASVLGSPAYALWPFGDDDVKTGQQGEVLPLAADWKEEHCEPFRQEAIKLNQTMASWNIWREIRVSGLKRKHRACIAQFEDQEYAYLKSVRMGNDPNADTTPERPY